ncbi:bifunctional transcriptional activator/DNA repair enzyme AdaA [uncultured Arthrobacter sp.]|uniref:bifunctional transcriptional activator/DNA repair enzyme AdaA n=1 Tax=uncultured Arthrobacter sp. TaxID=114050 RepID=UPI002621D288|nr:Ada metal-binding domain-containing protein [uncultured Arthrobacter sp.]
MDFGQQYAAIDARDARFDGQFITAVSSTGIYCRPSCPARTPKPANVTFYRTSAAAHDAGYRACKRCLPDAVPGDPAWDLRRDTAARAMRLIADGEVDRTGVDGLAARLGYSPRQLGRILRHELGAGALALARAQRAQTARTLLTASTLRFADVAFAAGFGSVRQFNDTLQHIFDLTPGQVRATARRGNGSGPPGTDRDAGDPLRISLLLPTRLPYDNGIFDVLREQAVAGVEQASASTYARTLRLPGGPAWFRAEAVRTDSSGGAALPVTVSVGGLGDLPPLLSRIRRLFDLDADPMAVDLALSCVPVLRGLVASRPGLRVPGSVDAEETVLRALVVQDMPGPGTTAALDRLAAVGPAVEGPGSPLTRMFPSAQHIAAAPDALLPGSPAGRQALRAVAQQLASGALAVDVGADADELRSHLLDLDGVSAGTADYVVMRVLGHPDVELPYDPDVRDAWSGLAAQRAATTRATDATHATDAGGRPTLDEAMAAVRPWRSYATEHLRRAANPPDLAPEQAAPPSSATYSYPVSERK